MYKKFFLNGSRVYIYLSMLDLCVYVYLLNMKAMKQQRSMLYYTFNAENFPFELFYIFFVRSLVTLAITKRATARTIGCIILTSSISQLVKV